MTKKNSNIIIVIAVVGLLCILVLPSAFKLGKTAYEDFWRDFWTPFSNANTTITDAATIGQFGLTIYYEDGTNSEFQPLTLIPLRIDDGTDSPITKITLTLKVLIRYKGTMTEYKIDTAYTGDLKDAGGGKISTPFNEDISKLGTALTSDTINNVWNKEITADNIELLGLTDGQTYTLDFKLSKPVTVTTKFSGGTTETNTITSNDTVAWTFTFSKAEGINSLTVAFTGVTA